MANPPPVTALDDDVLTDFYDAGSLQRGRAYAVGGHAEVVHVGPGVIDAHCWGSAPSPYVVSIEWTRQHGSIGLADACSCPLEGACKHCVAAIITARRQRTPRAPTSTPGATSAASPAADWRRAFGDLPLHDLDVGEQPDLALQFAVRHPMPTRYAPDTAPSLTIRPMRRGKSGKWVKTGAAWRDIATPYAYELQGINPLQRSALRALVACGRIDHYYQPTQAVPLSQFEPDLWHLLDRAVAVGVELISERRDHTIEVAPTAAVVNIDLTTDETGAVTVSTGITVDGAPLDLRVGDVGLVGSPPHGLWVDEGERLRLVPFDAPLHATVARLATAAPITVPPGDVDELLDVYQPALARHAGVGSSDGTVTITTNRFESLVAIVERTAVDAANLRWMARYRRGERITDRPLAAPGGHRDRVAEGDAVRALDLPVHLLPMVAGFDGRPRDLQVSGPQAVTLLTEVVPWLESTCDVTVEVVGTQPELREATEVPLVTLRVDDGRDSTDWFDLHVDVRVGGETVPFVPLFTALTRGDEVLVLPSGTWLRLDRPELTRLRELIDEARGLAEPDDDEGVTRVNRFQVSWFDELAELGVVTEQSERWAANVGRMGALTAPGPVTPPAGLEAELRPYQQEGLDWLAFLHRNQLGGILADDMGLGKTVQTLALCLHVLETGPDARFLVVAPTSVVANWAHEAARFAPSLEVRTITETATRRGTPLAEAMKGAHLVITSYALFRIEIDDYASETWDLFLLDEAQFVKNHRSKAYQCARRLPATSKVALTGTPIENSLMDLWSLLSITAPGLYPDPKRFADTYRKPIERGEAPHLLATLQRRVAPLMRRRTKDAVLTELPPKIEQTIDIELSARHERIYDRQLQAQRKKVLGLVGDPQRNRIEILRSLTILRQLALDPGLIDEANDAVGSAKLDRLLEDLTQVVAEGHRALIFSTFTGLLARVRTRLDDAGIDHAYLDGRTRKRDDAIARFKDGDVPVFVISLKAGGFGLNLTEADYCFVLDPWWNPAAETQAVDRAHRMGQANPVVVYRYVSTGTIEEKVMELKARKAALSAGFLDRDDALAGALTADDIRALFDIA